MFVVAALVYAEKLRIHNARASSVEEEEKLRLRFRRRTTKLLLPRAVNQVLEQLGISRYKQGTLRCQSTGYRASAPGSGNGCEAIPFVRDQEGSGGQLHSAANMFASESATACRRLTRELGEVWGKVWLKFRAYTAVSYSCRKPSFGIFVATEVAKGFQRKKGKKQPLYCCSKVCYEPGLFISPQPLANTPGGSRGSALWTIPFLTQVRTKAA